MENAASLSGRIVVGGEVTPRQWIVALAREGEPTKRIEPGPDGEFRFNSLAPGMVAVTVRLFGDPQPFFERAGIALQPAEGTELGEIDVQGEVHPISFTVVDTAGGAVDGVVAMPMHGESDQLEGVYVEDGRATLMSRSETLSVLLYGEDEPNYSWRRVDDLRDGQEVVMRDPHQVVVVMPSGVSARGSGASLQFSVWPEDPGPSGSPWSGKSIRLRGARQTSSSSGSDAPPWIQPGFAKMGANGKAVAHVAAPGRYSISCSLQNAAGRGAGVSGEKQLIEVLAGQSQVTVVAAINQGQIDEALAKLRE